jgi:hypothetical protein
MTRLFSFFALAGLALAQPNSQSMIAGRVTDESGNPIPRARVWASRPDTPESMVLLSSSRMTEANSQGEFKVANLPPGRYYVSAMESPFGIPGPAQPTAHVLTLFPSSLDVQGAERIEVGTGIQPPAIDIRLRRQPVFSIRGKLVDPGGSPVTSVMLQTWPVPSITATTVAIAALESAMASMRRNPESFEIANLLPGTYVLNVRRGSVVNGVRHAFSGRLEVTITGQDVNGIEFVLTPGRDIPGTVRMENGAPAPRGLRVGLTGLIPFADGIASAGVDEDAAFLLETGSSGKYRVTVNPLPEGYSVKSILFGGAEVGPTGLDLTASPGGSLQIVLARP